MSNYNRQDQLKQVHQQRRSLTEKKANEAIDRLLEEKRPVNFKQVSELSGVSVATLYKHEELKQRILVLRNHIIPQTPRASKANMSDTSKDAIISSLKRTIKKLEQENNQLRNQLKEYVAKSWEDI